MTSASSNVRAAAVCSSHSQTALGFAVLFLLALFSFMRPAQAMEIKQVKSPGGIEAWLVEEHSVPLIALRFAFEGGSTQDPEGKEGVSNFLTAMLDEGAGDLESSEFQERMEDIAMRMSFDDSRDSFYGNLETLTERRDEAVGLLKLALTKPRFDETAVDRIRKQLLASISFAERDPDRVASKAWFKSAFPGHPYGKSAQGSVESIAAINREDLEAYRSKVFARSNLKVVVVGDITEADLGKLLDDVFGSLPEKPSLVKVADTKLPSDGKLEIIEMDVPQSVAIFGMGGLKRKDPDFMAAFVLNHIIGGGGFSARLMEEVREKRGLAYSVYSYLSPLDHAAIYLGSVATKNESIAESLSVIKDVLKDVADNGITQKDLDDAKQYLKGSYALRFDTNSKIANQLLGILQEDMGIDYVDKRNGLIDDVTLDDIKKAAGRFLTPESLLVTVVGKPVGLKPQG